jgi:AbrB family looped-hinge helix DNA binding protein
MACQHGAVSTQHDEVSAEVTLTSQGRVAIPREVREAADLQAGEKLHITVEDDGSLRLQTWEQKANRVRAQMAAQLTGGGSLVDELIAERREESRRERAEDAA